MIALSMAICLASLSNFVAVTEDSRQWEQVSNLSVDLSAPFLFGVSTATWQDSGAQNCPHSQWSQWENINVAADNRSGQSANLFKLYQTAQGHQEIISRLQKLHVTSYRFSIEWSHIEPQEGVFCQEALEHYLNFCKALRDADISPMVTLLHFSEPQWFHNKGSFEEESNIAYFLCFVQKIYPSLTQEYNGSPLVEYICTINEPAIDAFSRYVYGSFSPGQKLNFSKAGKFLYHALKAHAQIYDICKPMSPSTQIGIVHQRLCFIPTNFLISPLTNTLNQLINEAPLRFLNTGKFELHIPLFCHMDIQDTKPHADFLGLQYYSRPLIGFSGSTSYHEPMTQMPFREDPEGLYEAILDTYAKCPIPLIITENGISTHDETQRSRYLQRALYAMSKARAVIGDENLQGYYLWSFCKNAEWDMGMSPQNFGAYPLNAQGELAQEPHSGISPFIKTAKHSKNRDLNSKDR